MHFYHVLRVVQAALMCHKSCLFAWAWPWQEKENQPHSVAVLECSFGDKTAVPVSFLNLTETNTTPRHCTLAYVTLTGLWLYLGLTLIWTDRHTFLAVKRIHFIHTKMYSTWGRNVLCIPEDWTEMQALLAPKSQLNIISELFEQQMPCINNIN